MKINLKIANVAKETGALLTKYLMERGLTIVRGGLYPTICYGIPGDLEDINGNCGGGDKIRRLKQMDVYGVRTVPWFQGNHVPRDFSFPALARKLSGHGGEDIVPVFQPEEVPWRIASGWAWFSSYVPLVTEYRVWVWRHECLDVYEKVMRRPADYEYIGRNFRNGFDFEHVRQAPKAAVEEALKVVKALSFDFAAVDLLIGKDGLPYILEANTAPGVIRSGAQATLAKLADRMEDWAFNGQPARGY